MAPEPPPPLPLAANRAAVANRISLLLASRASVLKTMPLTRAPTTTAAARPQRDVNDEEELRQGTRANEGVGYVRAPGGAGGGGDSARDDRALRGRMLGKRKVGERTVRAKVESESDEGEGRSGLGKKKKRKVREVEADAEAEDVRAEESSGGQLGAGVEEVVEGLAEPDEITNTDAVEDMTETVQAGTKKRKRKKKNKKKQRAVAP